MANPTPAGFTRWSFLWSEARLIVAALALFLGGVPVLYAALPVPALFGVERIILILAWVASGLAAGYLLYQWSAHGRKLFGGGATADTVAFFVCVVSGFNLGIAGLSGVNVGMTISSNYAVFVVVGLIYLATAVYLYRHWAAHGKSLF